VAGVEKTELKPTLPVSVKIKSTFISLPGTIFSALPYRTQLFQVEGNSNPVIRIQFIFNNITIFSRGIVQVDFYYVGVLLRSLFPL
jgi:hypothetical protein